MKEKKKTCHLRDFAIPADHRVRLKESKKTDEYLDLARELKKLLNEGDCDTNCSGWTWNSTQMLGKGTGRIVNQRKNQDHLDYNNVEIGKKTEKNPGDQRKLAVTQIPVKDHQLKLVWKTHKEQNNNNNNNNNSWQCFI